jgi:hypothetical protein
MPSRVRPLLLLARHVLDPGRPACSDTLRPNFNKVEAKLALLWPLLRAADPAVAAVLTSYGLVCTRAPTRVRKRVTRMVGPQERRGRNGGTQLGADLVQPVLC